MEMVSLGMPPHPQDIAGSWLRPPDFVGTQLVPHYVRRRLTFGAHGTATLANSTEEWPDWAHQMYGALVAESKAMVQQRRTRPAAAAVAAYRQAAHGPIYGGPRMVVEQPRPQLPTESNGVVDVDVVVRVQRALGALLNGAAGKLDAVKSHDLSQQLQRLYAELRASRVDPKLVGALLQTAQAVEAHDYVAADRAQVELSRLDWTGCECWLPGVRWLVGSMGTTCGPTTGGKSDSLVGAPILRRPQTARENSGQFFLDSLPPRWDGSEKCQRQAATHEALASSDRVLIRKAFGTLLLAARADERKHAEAALQFDDLYSKLDTGLVKRDTSLELLRLAQAVNVEDFAGASRCMSEVDWAESKAWLIALKRLLQRH